LIRVYFVIALIILVFFLLRKFLKTPPEIISKQLKKTAIVLFLGVIVFFTATGRLNWLFALTGVFIAFIIRMLPLLMRYLPQLHGLWRMFNKTNSPSSGSHHANQYKGTMSKQEAVEVLGITLSASKTEIIMAHRKLMQKMHPDRGGSDYLAAKINQAKAVLLNSK